MKVLYSDSGAGDFELAERGMSSGDWLDLRARAIELLDARSERRAASWLELFEWSVTAATNHFNDSFMVLHTSVPTKRYVMIERLVLRKVNAATLRTAVKVLQELGTYIRFVFAELAVPTPSAVTPPVPAITSASVESALKDAEVLIRSRGPQSAVDRAHTALHGFLVEVIRQSGIPAETNASLTHLFKVLRSTHRQFKEQGIGEDDVRRIMMGLATVVDAVNALRNHASSAHPNERSLGAAEAMLVVNTSRTLLHFLDARLSKDDGSA